MTKKIEFRHQVTLAETFVSNNCEKAPSFDYKKTSHLLALEVSKWCGYEIENRAIREAVVKFKVRKKDIAVGIEVYALKTRKK